MGRQKRLLSWEVSDSRNDFKKIILIVIQWRAARSRHFEGCLGTKFSTVERLLFLLAAVPSIFLLKKKSSKMATVL